MPQRLDGARRARLERASACVARACCTWALAAARSDQAASSPRRMLPTACFTVRVEAGAVVVVADADASLAAALVVARVDVGGEGRLSLGADLGAASQGFPQAGLSGAKARARCMAFSTRRGRVGSPRAFHQVARWGSVAFASVGREMGNLGKAAIFLLQATRRSAMWDRIMAATRWGQERSSGLASKWWNRPRTKAQESRAMASGSRPGRRVPLAWARR